MARYLYLPRVRDADAVLGAIHDGLQQLTWQTDTFAYAESWDEARGRYLGLRSGQATRVLADGGALLVRPEVAAAQMAADQQQAQAATGGVSASDATGGAGVSIGGATILGGGRASGGGGIVREPAPIIRRFHGSVTIDPLRLGRDASQIAEEVVQHFTRVPGARVEITLEIQADLPDGAPEKLIRDVSENCRTLRFSNHGFEES